MTPTPEDIQRLREHLVERRVKAEMATPGPWETAGFPSGCVGVNGKYVTYPNSFHGADIRDVANAEHIAANDPRTIIADCDALIAVIDRHGPKTIGHCGVWPCTPITDVWTPYAEMFSRGTL